MNKGQQNDRLSVQDWSRTERVFLGLSSFLSGILCCGFLALFFTDNWKSDTIYVIIFFIILFGFPSIFCFFVFINMIFLLPNTYTFDRKSGVLKILRRTIFGKKVKQYQLSHITGVELVSLYNLKIPSYGQEITPLNFYTVVLVLRGSDSKGNPKVKRVNYSSAYSIKKQRDKAELVASFLGLVVQEKNF